MRKLHIQSLLTTRYSVSSTEACFNAHTAAHTHATNACTYLARPFPWRTQHIHHTQTMHTHTYKDRDETQTQTQTDTDRHTDTQTNKKKNIQTQTHTRLASWSISRSLAFMASWSPKVCDMPTSSVRFALNCALLVYEALSY